MCVETEIDGGGYRIINGCEIDGGEIRQGVIRDLRTKYEGYQTFYESLLGTAYPMEAFYAWVAEATHICLKCGQAFDLGVGGPDELDDEITIDPVVCWDCLESAVEAEIERAEAEAYGRRRWA